MTESSPAQPTAEGAWNPRLAILLAMAMFVLVVDTTLMNVSISSVVADLGTTVSDVQAAIALEALVSAAFILISSKVGDLIGRKKAYVLGLLGYAAGALTMTLTDSIGPMVFFWAIFGGLGASLLLPAMQSLIHGNFAGDAQRDELRRSVQDTDALHGWPRRLAVHGDNGRGAQRLVRLDRGCRGRFLRRVSATGWSDDGG